MSATGFLFAVLCIWLLTGIVCSFVMARRGHEMWSWGVLGAVFGPLVIPLAIAASRRERTTGSEVRVLHIGQPGPGPISVLVGVDASAEAASVARRVVDLLGPQLGGLTLATVINFDEAEASARTDVHRASARAGSLRASRRPSPRSSRRR